MQAIAAIQDGVHGSAPTLPDGGTGAHRIQLSITLTCDRYPARVATAENNSSTSAGMWSRLRLHPAASTREGHYACTVTVTTTTDGDSQNAPTCAARPFASDRLQQKPDDS